LISDGPHALEIKWKASTTPGGTNGSLTFWIDGTQQGNLTGLDIDYQTVRAKIGALTSVTGWSGPVYFDCFEANFDHYIGLDPSAPAAPGFPTKTDALFADNFESGNFSAWSASATGGGDLSVSTQAALSGTYGMKAVINDNNAVYVTDWKPFEKTHYRARFYFDPNTITMSNGNAHYLLYALNRSDVVVARVEVARNSSVYQVRAAVVNDSTTWSSIAWTTISDAPHKLEFDWKAATAPGANNGGITFWVDGVQKGTFTNIDNDTRKVDYVQFGAVAGIDTGTRGTEYFDAFVSRRVSYIGMENPGSVLFGMAEPGSQNEQFLASLEVAQKNLAAAAPLQQPAQAIGESPLVSVLMPAANLPATGLSAAQQSQVITTTVVISYAYDPLNRLTAADYDGGMYFHYTYDAVGNQLIETTNVLTSEYGYDDANRLVTASGVSYVWDDNGNLLSDGVYTYTYDTANRLIGVSWAGVAASYEYNGFGDRLSEIANSQTTEYTMDLNAGLTQVLQNGTNTYLYGAGRVAQYGANGPEYYLGDALGSVRQLVDANGNVTMAKDYKPYGDVLSSEENTVFL
jgi:YD repeat-containing protein